MKSAMEKDTAVSSFSHAIEGINKATANLKSLRRASKKIRKFSQYSRELKALIKCARGNAACLREIDKSSDLEGKLNGAIHKASMLQEDREIVQKTLGKHRNLNPF